MPTTTGVKVRGLREAQRAFARAGRDAKKRVRDELRHVADPVARTAEGYARSRIENIGEKWPLMRVGVTTRVVYVAPKQRGVRGRGSPRKRPNLAELLMARAMEPALTANAGEVERGVERALDRIADEFNRGGTT